MCVQSSCRQVCLMCVCYAESLCGIQIFITPPWLTAVPHGSATYAKYTNINQPLARSTLALKILLLQYNYCTHFMNYLNIHFASSSWLYLEVNRHKTWPFPQCFHNYAQHPQIPVMDYVKKYFGFGLCAACFEELCINAHCFIHCAFQDRVHSNVKQFSSTQIHPHTTHPNEGNSKARLVCVKRNTKPKIDR